MKQTLFFCLLLFCFCKTSKAYHETTDSIPKPSTEQYANESIVGGFSFMSLFEESESFSKNSWVVHLGSGFRSDVEASRTGLKKTIPPLFLFVETAVAKNIGAGIKAGYRLWSIPKFDYRYHYYIVNLRATYHFNVHPKVDPYLGVSLTGRFLTSTGNLPSETNRNIRFSPFLIGCRYYLKPKFGVFAEFTGDGLTNFHGGLVFKLK